MVAQVQPVAQLRRFLTECVVVRPGESEAHEAGRLLAMTRTADVVGRRSGDGSPSDDIGRLVRASGRAVAVVAV